MSNGEKVVVRFTDGKVIKGFVTDFSIDSETINLNDETTSVIHQVPIVDLKAIFFVKSFKGMREHVEKKAFGIRKIAGRKVFVKFNDKESLVGIIEGDVPWDKGFSLAKLGEKAKGFFLTPVDGNCNNDKVFVVGSAIEEVTIMVV